MILKIETKEIISGLFVAINNIRKVIKNSTFIKNPQRSVRKFYISSVEEKRFHYCINKTYETLNN